jgi:hypothetical protein
LERVFLLGFVLAMLETLYCNDTIDRYNGMLTHELFVVKVVVAEFRVPEKDGKSL